MAPFSLSSKILESVKASMEERLLDMMIGLPTTGKIDDITEQLAKCIAWVRINAKKWASGKFGCLPLALKDEDLMIATIKKLTLNEGLPKPTNVHVDNSDETGQKDLIRLTKHHDTVWAAYHVHESALEISISILVKNVEV